MRSCTPIRTSSARCRCACASCRRTAGNWLEIAVKDHGIGIADVAQARTPLYTTGGEERSGMGFTIMESFMDTLRVKSVPGRGTTVTMCRRIRRRA